jgi:putative transposase
LSFPHALRYRLTYDSDLITDVLDIFIKTVFASLIRRAAEFGAVRKAQCGAVSFIQRFGSALDLNLHIHAILLDGIYAADDEGRPHFQVLLSPDHEEVARVTAFGRKRLPIFSAAAAWDRKAIERNPIRSHATSRGWPAFMPRPSWAEPCSVPMPAAPQRAAEIKSIRRVWTRLPVRAAPT